jgi:uncharacterized membrane protein YfcA
MRLGGAIVKPAACLLVALAVSAATFVKGSIGFGAPTLGTPLLTLIVDVKTAFPPGCPAGGSRRR